MTSRRHLQGSEMTSEDGHRLDGADAGRPAGAACRAAGRHAVRVEFGRRWVSPELAASLQPGSILDLDGPADAVEVYADNRLLARGLSGVVDGKLCVKIGRVIRRG